MMTQTMDKHAVDLDRLSQMSASELLRFAFEVHGQRAAIGTSFQKTGVVIIDLASRLGLPYRVFTIDTGFCHDETYELMDQVERRYGIEVERYRPAPEDVEDMNRSVGQYAHFLARPMCCKVRKQKPLQNALGTLDAWISGVRRDQSNHRGTYARRASWTDAEDGHRILKLNPLLNWSARNVEAYSRDNDLPYNKLYDYVSPYGERYQVLGCKQCHIPVRDDLGPRAGKFPWEQGKKECGLHNDGSGI